MAPSVVFNTVLGVTVDPDSSSAAIVVDTAGCVAGDVIFMVLDGVDFGNVTLPANLDISDVFISETGAGGGHTAAESWMWFWDGVQTSYQFGITTAGPAASMAAVACAYSNSIGSGAGARSFTRFITPSVTLGPLTPTIIELLVSGQGFAGDTTSHGSVDSPFTLRASSVGRQAPSDSRFPQAQIADAPHTAAATSVTWNNTNTTVSAADRFGGTGFVMEGIGAFYYILALFEIESTGLHVWSPV